MTAPIIEAVDELRSEYPGITWEKLAKKLGHSSGEALRSAYRRERTTNRENREPDPQVEFLHLDVEVPDWRDFADKAEDTSKFRSLGSKMIKETRIVLHTEQPIGIVFTGDWHLGDASVDYAKWKQDMSLIVDYGLYLVDLGDSRQNVRSFRDLSAVLGQSLTPQEQALMMRGLIDELTRKNLLLAKVDGNHDVEFDEKLFGESLQWYLLEKMKAPRFVNKGLIFLEVGDETYTIYVFHKSRFRSIYRSAHGAWREWQFGYPADIVAGGHDHRPAFEMLPAYQMARESGMDFGGLTFLLKVGTYQDSRYGWKYFHNGGQPECLTLILWPNQHKMQVFLSIQDAVRFLDTYKE